MDKDAQAQKEFEEIVLDADGETLQRWTGEAWSMEPTFAEFAFADLSLFKLFLNRNQVGILWERV